MMMRLLKYLGPWRPGSLVGCLLWAICSILTFVSQARQSTYEEAYPHYPWEDPVERARNERITRGAVREYAGISALTLVATGCAAGVNVRRLRRYRGIIRTERGLCPRCGYDLTGNVSGTCPECGTVPARTGSSA
jgi:hypothetical protein